VLSFSHRPGGGSDFAVRAAGSEVRVRLPLNGIHNAVNATGALAVASLLGAPLVRAAASLAGFAGTERRFETVYRDEAVWIVDDYAHHPTAVRATLAAARAIHPGRILAIFQPHTSNRLAELFDQFLTAFQDADRLFLTPVYEPTGRGRGERPVSSAMLAGRIDRPPTRVAESLAQAETLVAEQLQPGDLVLVMGAGDVTSVSRGLATRRAGRPPAGAAAERKA
jgi:UDP-N-acetylmuramate--alanine ligase